MSPNVYIIAGPNGAGKTTFAREFLPIYAKTRVFINADLIAQGLSPLAPEAAAFHAGRLVLQEIDTLVKRQEDFGFETTLSGKSYLHLLRELKKHNYALHLFFLWVPTVDVSISRVKDRVFRGGHNVPETDLRRRYERSIRNFLQHYRHLADSWQLFDNSITPPLLIARKDAGELSIMNKEYYELLIDQFGND